MSEGGALRIAAAPINWGVYRLDPNNPPPDQLLNAIVECGYEGCELGPLGYLVKQSEDLATTFVSRQLALVSAFVAAELARPLEPATIAEFEAVIDLLAAGGSRVLLLSDSSSERRAGVVGQVESHPETWWSDDDWRQVAHNVERVSAMASAGGLTLAFHHHVATHVESPREIRRLLTVIDPATVKLCLDTGHALIGGADPVDVFAEHGDRIVHLHAKDVDGALLDRLRAGELTYSEAVRDGLYADLGDGRVNWRGFADAISRIDYRGWIVVEQDRHLTPDDPRPVPSLRRNRQFLRQLLQA